MLAALAVRDTSVCDRRRVGCALVRNGEVVLTAANGPLGCFDRSVWTDCLRDRYGIASGQRHEICRGLHAEQRLIVLAARQGIATAGAELYVTSKPCSVCAKLIVEAGVVAVTYLTEFPDAFADEVLELGRVRLTRWLPREVGSE